MAQNNKFSKAFGCLVGMGLGDALGLPTEFMSYTEIRKKYPNGLKFPPSDRAIMVTDDTQMAIAVGRALKKIVAEKDIRKRPAIAERAFRHEFVCWLHDPDNFRAPGFTCMSACHGLDGDTNWLSATIRGSKGCGANMRVQPVGLLKLRNEPWNDSKIAPIAQLQGAMTHGHPTSLTASDLTAFVVGYLATGGARETLIDACFEYCDKMYDNYYVDYLENLWEITLAPSPTDYIHRGWDECIAELRKVEKQLRHPDTESDPSEIIGRGSCAESCLATALYCFLLFPEDPLRVIEHASITDGDSDSIAAMAGSFVGTHLGIEAWPVDLVERLEYLEILRDLAEFLVQ